MNPFEVLDRQQSKDLLKFLTCGSVDDGKSTLIGRILHDTDQIFDDQLSALKSDARAVNQDGDLELGLLLDGLQAEREQGITIDVAYRYFTTEKRKFIIADCPGHEQYTRNMATGASHCDAAVLLIDARYGVQKQTRRHAFICSLFGIRHFICAVNKMDLTGFDQKVYENIIEQFESVKPHLKADSIDFIPVSALKGDNVVELSSKSPWYSGKTLLESLEDIPVSEAGLQRPARFPVQYVNRPNPDFRGFSGTLSGGTLAVGQAVRVLPSGKTSTIASIPVFSEELQHAHAGQAVTITLEDEIDISRGDWIVPAHANIHLSNRFHSYLIWFSEKPAELNHSYDLKIAGKTTHTSITEIEYLIDVNTYEENPGSEIRLNDIAVAAFETAEKIVLEDFDRNPDAGSFILIDRISHETVAAGVLKSVGHSSEDKNISEFEIAFNALVRKHFPHWHAIDISKSI